MSINHHLLSKTSTDAVLANFKNGAWNTAGGLGANFYRIGCDSGFPAPDAAFFENTTKTLATFEFKPPTENKRGILTGLGQVIAYLNSSNLAFLVIPERLDDFEMGDYMDKLFNDHLSGHLPVGLITYANNDASSVTLRRNVDAIVNPTNFNGRANRRFWAKWVDLPVPLFHLILHCYYLKKVGIVRGDAFAYCYSKYLVPRRVLKTLQPVGIPDLAGDTIRTAADQKEVKYFEKKLALYRPLTGAARAAAFQKLRTDVSTAHVGDNYYQSIRKNLNTFVKHVGCIDSEGGLTDTGFRMYHLGLVNGPNSKLFRDYFARLLLLTGNHIDLIFDLNRLIDQSNGHASLAEVRTMWYDDYNSRGMIKRNPGRVAGTVVTVEELKYEFIIWRSLALMVDAAGLPGVSFDWKRITEVCSLPEL